MDGPRVDGLARGAWRGVRVGFANALLLLPPVLRGGLAAPDSFRMERHAPATGLDTAVAFDQQSEVGRRDFVQRFDSQLGHVVASVRNDISGPAHLARACTCGPRQSDRWRGRYALPSPWTLQRRDHEHA